MWSARILGSTLLAHAALGQNAPSKPSSSRARAASSSQVVPAGTVVPIELKNTVNSHTAYDGQAVYCETIFPIALGDHILIPAHSYVRGEVTHVTRPGRVSGKAQLGLRFDSIILPSGVTRPILATLSSIGGARLEDAKKAKDAEAAASNSGAQNVATQSAGDAVVDARAWAAGTRFWTRRRELVGDRDAGDARQDDYPAAGDQHGDHADPGG